MRFLNSQIILFLLVILVGVMSGQSSVSEPKTSTLKTNVDSNLIKGKVKAVYDGDTIGMEGKDGKLLAIRLQAIDAPDNGQNYGRAARKSLSGLIEGKSVVAVIHGKDDLGRFIANIYVDGDDIGLKLLEAGLAWHFKKYSYDQAANDRKRYAQAEVQARAERRGLWEDKSPVPPWEFRGEDLFDTKAALAPKTSIPIASPEVKKTDAILTSDSMGKKYVLGPRGGCYYLNDSGVKVYVRDKSLCGKQ